MNNNNDREATFADFRMRYQITIEDIKHIKNREWTVTYYLLLLFAAIIGFYKTVNTDVLALLWIQRVILSLIAAAVAIVGQRFFLSNFQNTLIRYRDNLVNHITKKLTPEYQRVTEELMFKRYGENWHEEYINQSRRDKFTFIFCFMLWIGAGFVIWYVLIVPILE